MTKRFLYLFRPSTGSCLLFFWPANWSRRAHLTSLAQTSIDTENVFEARDETAKSLWVWVTKHYMHELNSTKMVQAVSPGSIEIWTMFSFRGHDVKVPSVINNYLMEIWEKRDLIDDWEKTFLSQCNTPVAKEVIRLKESEKYHQKTYAMMHEGKQILEAY